MKKLKAAMLKMSMVAMMLVIVGYALQAWVAPALLHRARDDIEKIAREQCQCTLEIGRFTTTWFPVGIIAQDVHMDIGPFGRIRAQTMGVHPHMLSLLHGIPELRSIVLSDVHVDLNLDHLPQQKANSTNPLEHIRSLEIDRFHGKLRHQDKTLTINRLDAVIQSNAKSTSINIKQFDHAITAQQFNIASVIDSHIHIEGPIQRPIATAIHMTANNLTLGQHRLGDLRIHSAIQKNTVKLHTFNLRTTVGDINLEGSIELKPSFPTQLTLHAERVALAPLLEFFEIKDPWIRLTANANYKARGTLNPLYFEGDFDAHVPRFESLNQSYHNPKAEIILALNQSKLTTHLTVTPRMVALKEGRLSTGHIHAHINGNIHYHRDFTGYDLVLDDPHFDLDSIGPIASIPFRGVGHVHAVIKGPIDNPDIHAQTHLQDFGILDLEFGETQAQARYHSLQLHINDATTQLGTQGIGLQGLLNFKTTPIFFTADTTLNQTDLRSIFLNLRLLDGFPQNIQLPLTGQVHLEGPFTALNGQFDVQAHQGNVASIPLTQTHATGSFGPGGNAWKTSVRTHAGSGQLLTDVAYADGKGFSIHMDAASMPLGLFTHGKLTGTLESQIHLEGPLTQPDGNIHVAIADLRTLGGTLGDTLWDASLHHGHITWTAQTASKSITGEGNAHLDITGGKQESIWHVESLDLDNLGIRLPNNTQARVSGEIQTQGPVWPLSAWHITSQWHDTDLHWNSVHVQQQGIMHINSQKKYFELTQGQFANEQLNVTLQGQMTSQQDITGKITVQGLLETTEPLFPTLGSLRGNMDATLHIDGPLKNPTIMGNMSLKDGNAVVDALGRLDNVQLNAVIYRESAHIRELQAELGKGRIHADGRIDFVNLNNPILELHAQVEHVTLQPFKDFESVFSGRLSLTGPWETAQLQGDIVVDALRFTRPIELKSLLLAKHNNVRNKSRADHIVLGIRLRAPSNVVLANNLLEAELRIDTTITGTMGSPGILGSITPLWGKVKYRNSVFNIDRAMLDFIDENSIKTFFDIEASTQACGMNAKINIQGSNGTYTLLPSGQDPQGSVEPSDVLSCLQFGLRLREFAGPNSRGVGLAVPGGLDTLWAVTGLDSEVKKRLPFTIDQLRLSSRWSSISRTTTSWVLVGKNLTPNFELQYARSLQNVDEQEFLLRYRVSNLSTAVGNWTVNNITTYGDFGLDLQFAWQFD